MLRALLGLAPQKESDGSFRPSKLALKLATSDVTDYKPVSYQPYKGKRFKVLVLLTENENMTMKNGRAFSTGNHPVETFVPMLHLKNAGFEFEIVTSSGGPGVFEMWAMPTKDSAVMSLYEELKPRLEKPRSLPDLLESLSREGDSYAAVFIPGGHGAMLGIPQDSHVGTLLRWAHDNDRFTISLCHGPGSLLSTTLEGKEFLYSGYEMAVFPDSMDRKTPMLGYLPGHMPWELESRLAKLGARIGNKKPDDTCCIDRKLITGASPDASDKLGNLAAIQLLGYLAQSSREN